ncbi:hypothetical protein Tsubulata_032718 [Turnera subulata]|uniref:Kinesin motor domain-containing protein n=1 Tax=Turnera subulata TaxID=218843 RepID=A0A9Q0FCV2_9ROSI|nr:hypothetical protein Tsubulata_032718 [Turnera subulata]
MPFLSEATSAIKSRFGFHDRPSAPEAAVPSTPDVFNSVSRGHFTPGHSLASASVVRRIPLCEDDETMDRDRREVVLSSAAEPQRRFEFDEDPSFWKDRNVQVIIRLRPLSSSEISVQGHSKCVRQESCQTITWTGHPESRFTFDLVADEGVSQEKLFKVAGMPMVDNCMGGYNSCMFAYGQTGSGKTHTMLGDIEEGTRRHSVNCGMTPRVFEYLFTRIQKEKDVRKDEKIRYTCKCSFLEIYNEQILDLLDPSSTNLQIREDVKKGVYVENIKEIEVSSARDVIQQLVQGAANRKVAATNMNRASSRSHSVFTCIIESKWESQGVIHHRFARLNLVDLAGSERQKSSGAEGERLKEATNINKSLSTLGSLLFTLDSYFLIKLVIMNLVSISNGKSLHVPYRDSKLTFLLQDSLGGNSKTTIIANISPSICSSLETLSTLKFAQRAKFIKNNAIINEDASGDVIAMRMQIQQLKRENARLRALAHEGADTKDLDTSAVSFLGSPGSLKWEGIHGSFSPLMSERRISQKKDYEVALVGAFRREKDKDAALKALEAENQAALQLAKQREDEIQGLKMRLRFREAGIKRLEAVASGKISAETHLLKEKEEHLKEIAVLRTQVDRNQEVTRFAMENLRLKEEIRRHVLRFNNPKLKSLYEEGEREMMLQQITVLQNKLLEALDWKLMHESESVAVHFGFVLSQQKENLDMETESRDDQLIARQGQRSAWDSSINEENEFLRVQAIQNQSEIDTLHKQLDFCLQEKERLERLVNDLTKKLEEEGSSRAIDEGTRQADLPSLSTDIVNHNDQMEIKTMVDAIAAASQREAEAHEKAIRLSQENDDLQLNLQHFTDVNNDLQSKIKALIEEKNSLIEMYEKAMHERDELKRHLSSGGRRVESRRDLDCPEKLVEVDGGQCLQPCGSSLDIDEEHMVEDRMENVKIEAFADSEGASRLNEFEASGQCCMQIDMEEDKLIDPQLNEFSKSIGSDQNHTEADAPDAVTIISEIDVNPAPHSQGDRKEDSGDLINSRNFSGQETDLSNPLAIKAPEDIYLVRTKLETAHERISDSAKVLTALGLLEKDFFEFDKLLRELEAAEEGHRAKVQEFRSLEHVSSEMQEKKALADKKLSALRFSLSNFCASVAYYEQRESRARARVDASRSFLAQKKEELAHLQLQKGELDATLGKIQQSEVEIRNNHVMLKSKLEEENQRLENEKVLLTADNIENVDVTQRNWHLGGKATELLKSEEEKSKLQTEMKLSREKLALVRKEIEALKKRNEKIQVEMQAVQKEIQKGARSAEEMEHALQVVVQEKDTLLEVSESGMSEIQSMVLEYQQHVFDADLKVVEMKISEEEVQTALRRVEELRKAKLGSTEKMTNLLEGSSNNSGSSSLTERIEQELMGAQASLLEAKTLLGEGKPDNR